MRPRLSQLFLALLLFGLVSCSLSPAPTAVPLPTASPLPPPSATPQPTTAMLVPTPAPDPATSTPGEPTAVPPFDPLALVSEESLLAFDEDLASIQAYSGWRNSASQGEAEALDYVAQKLGEFDHLSQAGMALERQSFHVFLGTELWETRLFLTAGGQEVEVPANGLRGPRDEADLALRFDSDGVLNDAERNPVTVEGAALLLRSASEVEALSRGDVQGNVVFLDYAVIDRVLVDPGQALDVVVSLLDKEPAGVVLVTSFSNEQGTSHGTFVGDSTAFNYVEDEPVVPVLYARIEDLGPAGVQGWDDLAGVESARLTWDADVFSPADSGNLVAHLPGADPTRAMILGAHIDSPNAPGALDDGSGSALLLEVARVLDEARIQPPIDLYLAWFGSEELGLYGSSYFAATHQELLDRTVAMLQTDMLSRPLDGLPAALRLVSWSYAHLGDGRLLWPEYLAGVAAELGVEVQPADALYFYSDNNSFGGFGVPHADLIYEPPEGLTPSIHYASHVHDPYDTVELAREMKDVFGQMARLAVAAVLETGRQDPGLRVTPPADRRVVFVASHTEPVHMTPSSMAEVGMAFTMRGFDVDLVPYGQAVTAGDLQSADLVVVLPVVDYPSPGTDPNLYDEAWTAEEIDVLQAYADGGGLLVLTNSAHRLKYGNQGMDVNEDWRDVNDLAARFGVTYGEGQLPGARAASESESPLMAGVRMLELGGENGVPFEVSGAADAQVLAQVGGQPAVALFDFGPAGGQVLVLADVGILGSSFGQPQNLPFWQNLADYARSR